MKCRICWLLLLSISFFANTSVTLAQKIVEQQPVTYAVVVGISTYSDPEINALKYADKDAESYRNFLLSPNGGSVPTANTILLTNEKATRSAILGALRAMFQKATSEDVVIFYYAGHGIPDAKIARELYFATYDTFKENYVGTALLKGQVENEFVNSPAKLKVFLADACHSGGTGIYLGTRDDASTLVNKLMANINSINEPSWAAVTAASRAELSVENEKWGGGHGVFTYYLIKGLEGEADKPASKNKRAKGNGNGIVTVREIFDYLNNIIPAETNDKQHPDKQGFNEDVFPLSAVTPDLFAGAVQQFVKQASPSLATDIKAAPVVKQTLETPTLEMNAKNCSDGSFTYGEINFINNYKEDVLLYYISNHQGSFPLNILIAKDENTSTGRLTTDQVNSVAEAVASRDVKLYFRTIDESKPVKYGAVVFNVQTCKTKTYILSSKNLYLTVAGEKL